MTAFTVTWQTGGRTETATRPTWSEAVGVQAAHQGEAATLTIVDPRTAPCLYCDADVTQTTTPHRWVDWCGHDRCPDVHNPHFHRPGWEGP